MTVGALLLTVGALGVLPAATAQGADPVTPNVAAVTESNIRIVQTPSGGGGLCLPPALALRQSTRSDATTFRLIIRVTAPLCSRVNAVAAIYQMPGNGVAWPQTLLETAPLTLKEPGTTEVIFTKTCTPVQFDVITGATPTTISPTGTWHGPLLFPFDTSTSLQWFGCGTTTSTSTTSTSTSSTTTTIDDGCENYTPSNVTVSPSTARPGDSLTVSGTGTPGTLVQALLEPPEAAEGLSPAEIEAGFVALSDPALVQPDGTWTTALLVPSDAAPGTWRVVANAVGCETRVTTEVTIVAEDSALPPTPSTEPPVVAGETAVNPAGPEVAGIGVERNQQANSSPGQVRGLAFTGSAAHLPIALGIAMITIGGVLLLGARRRNLSA